VNEVAARTLDLPVRLAKPEKLTGMADTLRNPSYSTSVGLLRLGLSMDSGADTARTGSGQATGLGQIFRGLLRGLLPDDDA